MIRVGFSTTNGLISRIIRLFTKSRFSHTWISYPHQYFGMDVIVEADLKGIREVPYNRVVRKWRDVVELSPPNYVNLEYGMEKIGPTLGSEYDLRSLFGRALVYIGRWFSFKIRNPLRNSRQDTCVDNVYRLLTAVDDRFHDIDIESESPQTLYDRLLESGWRPIKSAESTSKGSNGHT